MNVQSIEKKLHQKLEKPTLFEGLIGEVIKRRRLEQRLTQEALSKGLCSISYLSKLENNKAKPDVYVVEEVSKRVGIPVYDLKYSDIGLLDIHKALNAFFYGDIAKIDHMLDCDQSLVHPTIVQIVTLIRNVAHHEHKTSVATISKLEPLVHSMPLEESLIFLVFSMIYYFEIGHNKKALSIAWMLDQKPFDNDYLKAIYHLYAYIIKQTVNHKASSFKHYNQAEKVLLEYTGIELSIQLKLYHVYFSFGEHKDEAKRLFDNIPASNILPKHTNFYLYLNMLWTIDSSMLDDIYSRSIVNKYDIWYYRLSRYYAMATQSEIEIDNHQNPVFQYEVAILQLLKLNDENETIDFIKNILLPLSVSIESIPEITEQFAKLITHTKNNKRYKEAMAQEHKKQKIIAQIENVS